MNDFHILPCRKNGVAYTKLFKDNFEYNIIKMSEDLASDNLYETLNLESKIGVILFKNSLLKVCVVGKADKDDATPNYFILSTSEIYKDNIVNKFIINETDIIETSNEVKTLEELVEYTTKKTKTDKICFCTGYKLFPKASKEKFKVYLKGIQETEEESTEVIDNTVAELDVKTPDFKEEHIENKVDNDTSDKAKEKELPTENNNEELTQKFDEDNKNITMTDEHLKKLFREFITEYTEELTASTKRVKAIKDKEEKLNDRELRIIEKEKELEDAIKQNKNLKVTLSEAIDIARDNTVDKIKTQVVGVDSIIASEDNINDNVKSTDLVLYESMIKAIRAEDVVSIPREVYSRLIVTLEKHLFMDSKYTSYRAIVRIKFEQQSINFMLAIVDYDEAEEYVKVHVLKPYNDEMVTRGQMLDYEIKYNEWRKRNSFINT